MSCVLHPSERGYIAGDWKDCAHNSRVEGTHKKRLVICCDGTWNNANEGKPPTNVSRLATVVAQKCCSGMPQLVYYHRGAGTDASMGARLLGGIFGTGVVEDIRDVYRFICDNYSPDDEIVIVGFSRGAFTARSVAGMVCSIGLLNGFGLYHFHEIFEDYQNFSKWDQRSFDRESDLKAFGAESIRSLDLQDYAEDLKKVPSQLENANWKKVDWKTQKEADEAATKLRRKWFEECKSERKTYGKDGNSTADRLEEISDWYLRKLEKFRMLHCTLHHETGWWIAKKVEITAIGVWDTVGSLGIPKGLRLFDWYQPGRSATEIRFASLRVHRNVRHAFHALALDEWRKDFTPTLWAMPDEKNEADAKRGRGQVKKRTKERKTQLRQVWFPGSHSDVGGGGNDLHIATISLAWMADQLSSVGVEFAPKEMRRLFGAVELEAATARWALGRTFAPPLITSIPDILRDGISYPVNALLGWNRHRGTRQPGLTKDDHKKQRLRNTNELIHPSVRIRYLYKGLPVCKGPEEEDMTAWDCPALTSPENGYRLRQLQKHRPFFAKNSNHIKESTYNTLVGPVQSVHGHDDADDKHEKVAKQLPFETVLRNPYPHERWIWEKDDKSQHRATQVWVWERWDHEKKQFERLFEERVGMWERHYMDTNQKHLNRGEKDWASTLPKHAWARSIGRQMMKLPGRVVGGVRDSAVSAIKAPFKIAEKVIYTTGAALGGVVQLLNPYSSRPRLRLFKPSSKHPKLDPRHRDYGLHDLIVWQQGDMRRYTLASKEPADS
ncbi:Uncharacterized protein Cob_v007544 [Colletotrichum orbiculare MAFF 240422]|uniref:T6SS Phospholipase effector Tle1-like catalytic domain-containing protein n=1 Tax=Colletotrichum orbiculare (strain 104-T / ATCC 96160 / CBS 514.97 / LARS 414 / MAFF 240422) TaxID=1213857 RepID=A0A484FMB8_COLOR|nr:Uncharacterized protein Cob_v007544 [Colletotrichum orbiculare MAFF 240422]